MSSRRRRTSKKKNEAAAGPGRSQSHRRRHAASPSKKKAKTSFLKADPPSSLARVEREILTTSGPRAQKTVKMAIMRYYRRRAYRRRAHPQQRFSLELGAFHRACDECRAGSDPGAAPAARAYGRDRLRPVQAAGRPMRRRRVPLDQSPRRLFRGASAAESGAGGRQEEKSGRCGAGGGCVRGAVARQPVAEWGWNTRQSGTDHEGRNSRSRATRRYHGATKIQQAGLCARPSHENDPDRFVWMNLDDPCLAICLWGWAGAGPPPLQMLKCPHASPVVYYFLFRFICLRRTGTRGAGPAPGRYRGCR